MDESSRQRVRHCERSEAIHLTAKRNNGLLLRFAPRDDGEHKPAFSRRESARVLLTIALEKQEGAGNAGCAVHPRPRVQQKAHALATTGTPPPAFPARWFTAYIALSPGTGLFCPRRSADKSANLNASVGASGPHDFAVRISAARPASLSRPPHPAPNVRDDREAPLLWVRDGGKNTHFLIFGKRNIRARRADSPDQVESVHEIRILVHTFFRPERRSRATTASKIELICPTPGKSVGLREAS